ncbi:hypothetical protein KEM56_004002 [Ascosphaera pollenicola]|nr:hypothetical protein KEM56_004002 [Ascosphaera pollenicola]
MASSSSSSHPFNASSGQERQIVIIGGGIIGCSTAYFLTRHPSYDPSLHKIVVIEASDIAAGASGKAGGLLALWAYPQCIVPLSFKLHAELAKEHNGKEKWGYRTVNCGRLVANGKISRDRKDGKKDKETKSGEEDGKAAVSAGATHPKGKSGRSVSLNEAKRMAPKRSGIPDDLDWLDSESLKLYEAMDEPGSTAQVHPCYFTKTLMQLAQEKGAEVIMGQVVDIKHTAKEGVRSVTYRTKQDKQSVTLDANDVIIAAGPWTSKIFPEAPISSLRAHSIIIKPEVPISAYALFTEINLPSGFKGCKGRRMDTPEIYARPDNTVYACGEGDTLAPLPELASDVIVELPRCQDVVDSITSISSALRGGEVIAHQACYLPNVSADRGGPIVGPTDVRGLFIATGHTCWGIQNGPGTGKLMSEFVFDGKATSARVDSLHPRHFLRK